MSKQTYALFALVLVLAYTIEYTYRAGKFYRNNLHEHVIEALKRLTAITLTLAFYVRDGIMHLYSNRTEYFTKLNNLRERVGQALSYQSPQFA